MVEGKLEDIDLELWESLKEVLDEDQLKDPECLMETLTEGNEVWEGERAEFRWYDSFLCVVEIGGRYFGYENYHMTGDACMTDMGLEYSLSTIREMEPKDVVTTIYVEK